MKFSTLIAAAAAAAGVSAQKYVPLVQNAINLLNSSAYDFANHTSLIAEGANIFSGPLQAAQFDIAALCGFVAGTQMTVDWIPIDNITDDAVAVDTTFRPIAVQINTGIINLVNKAAIIPVNNNPIPNLLNDFLDSFKRLAASLEKNYPARSEWMCEVEKIIEGNINVFISTLASSHPAQPAKSKRVCIPGSGCHPNDQPVPANDGPEFGHLPGVGKRDLPHQPAHIIPAPTGAGSFSKRQVSCPPGDLHCTGFPYQGDHLPHQPAHHVPAPTGAGWASKRQVTCPPGVLHCTGFPYQGEEETINFKREEEMHTDCPIWETNCIQF